MSVYDEKRDIGLNKPNRNEFNLSKNVQIGVQFGRLTPCACIEVLAGDSFSIDATYGTRFQQMAYPIASIIHQYTSWFYVPYSTLWKRQLSRVGNVTTNYGGFKEFYDNANLHIKNPNARYTFSFPYIKNGNKDFFKTGSLADYLGIPTTLPQSSLVSYTSRNGLLYGVDNSRLSKRNTMQYSDSLPSVTLGDTPLALTSLASNQLISKAGNNTWFGAWTETAFNNIVDSTSLFNVHFVGYKSTTLVAKIGILTSTDGKEFSLSGGFISVHFTIDADGNGTIQADEKGRLINAINEEVQKGNWVKLSISAATFTNSSVLATDELFRSFDSLTLSKLQFNTIVDAVDVDSCPFLSVNGAEPVYPISALPFRAYQAIYNAYFRRIDIDPFIDPISGVSTFDTFTNTAGGADSFDYHFYNKRFASDLYTSADPAPMLYDAPIVNIVTDEAQPTNVSIRVSNYAKDKREESNFYLKFKDDNTFEIVENGNNDQSIEAILKNSLGSGTGITMRDFNNARALERYLAACMRIGAGYAKYLEKINGTKMKRDDDFTLNVPRYLGGTSTKIDTQLISNSAETEQKALGDYVGVATSGDNGHISVYCDEPGLIIGLMSIVPEYADANRLDTHWRIPVNEWSFPNGENTHLQPTPLTYGEMCPIVAYNDSKSDPSKKLSDAFAYNDVWGEYKSTHDEVHGLFRKEYADYVISRQYDTRPILNSKFCECDPDKITDPFIVTHKNGDVGVCHIHLGIKAVRPLPRAVVPTI